jgi:outer membrane lipoprotein-sorting protein
VVVDDLKNVIGVYFLPSLILNFGSGWREIKKTNIISLSGEDEKCFIVKINSITGCSDNKKCELKIYVLKMSMCPYKVIVKSEGVLVEIVFKNYSINSVLKRAIFKFIKPEDVETIKLN